jgi:hypothetical protein
MKIESRYELLTTNLQAGGITRGPTIHFSLQEQASVLSAQVAHLSGGLLMSVAPSP